MQLPKHYDPKQVEDKIYKLWEKGNFFKPQKNGKSFTIVIPPPNITGSLHMGHALNNTMQDILVRRARMKGFKTLWVPGTDHAGIATQNVVEKKLRKEGKTRHDLGREKFIEEVWEWKKESGNTIIKQLKKLGCSCDWSHERFTMDKDYSQAVNTAFKHYYDKGLIYKGTRVINWCPRCQTAISDLENIHIEEEGKLYYIKYPVRSSKREVQSSVIVATTRPETLLGDTAVAVNPQDKRYKKIIGQKLMLPLVNREIPIVTDILVDAKFATGAVKVTPAHDLVDEQIGKNHNLPVAQVINQYGKMANTDYVPKEYQNLKVAEAREKIVANLQKNNFLEKIENYQHSVGHCERCNSVTEYLPSEQWFLKMSELAKPAIKAVVQGKIKFYPNRWKKVYIDWLKNIKDWCISRQLWWGHQIPIKGETDVLDTWFSSALWPFAVLGWPEKTKDLKEFYPTTTLSTARDILYLWVTRMVFSSLEFTKQIPFHEVYIHPTVFNKEGKRMSKSLGTGVDPLELIEKYGTDAVRFGLSYQNTGTQDIKFSEDCILTGKKFANKIFNASKFVISNLDAQGSMLYVPCSKLSVFTPADRLIIKKLNQTIKQVDKYLDKYQFGQAAHEIYEFFWHDFCDKYIEDSKNQILDAKLKENTQKILAYVLISSLKLLHPFMPFLTEEIHELIKAQFKINNKKMLINAPWPKV